MKKLIMMAMVAVSMMTYAASEEEFNAALASNMFYTAKVMAGTDSNLLAKVEEKAVGYAKAGTAVTNTSEGIYVQNKALFLKSSKDISEDALNGLYVPAYLGSQNTYLGFFYVQDIFNDNAKSKETFSYADTNVKKMLGIVFTKVGCFSNDEVIDVFASMSVEDVTVFENVIADFEQYNVNNKVFNIINTIDISYRNADVVKFLKTMNVALTMKMYDDEATWKPVVTKIRAMIEVRQ